MAGNFNPINFISYQNPAKGLKLQQQMELAKQLMEQGNKDEDINKLANPGGFVVPYSPLQGLAKAGDKIAGSYLQQKALAEALQAPKPVDMMGEATNAAIGAEGGMGPATKPDVASQYQQGLAGMLQGGQQGSGNQPTQEEMYLESFAPGMGKAQFEQRMKLQNATDEARIKAQYSVTPNAAGIPMPTSSYLPPQQPPAQPNFAAMMPPSLQGGQMPPPAANMMPPSQSNGMPPPPAMVNAKPQAPANFDELLAQQTPDAGGAQPVNLTAPSGAPLNEPPINVNTPEGIARFTEAKKAAETAGSGTITDVQKQEKGQKQIDEVADNMNQLYDKLDKVGAAVNTDKSSFENMAAYAGNSPVGQAVGKLKGTEEQSIRNQINQALPAMINSIRQATGMSAKAMDSNTELQFYLKMASDPTVDIQANKRAIANIRNMYGNPAASKAPPSELPHPQSIVDELRKRGVVK